MLKLLDSYSYHYYNFDKLVFFMKRNQKYNTDNTCHSIITPNPDIQVYIALVFNNYEK